MGKMLEWEWDQLVKRAISDLVKAYFRQYLSQQRQLDESKSVYQHFFNNNLISIEVDNYLEHESLEENLEVYWDRLVSPIKGQKNNGYHNAFDYLVSLFNLDRFETFCLLTMYMCEIQPLMKKVMAYLHNDWELDQPTTHLLEAVFVNCEPAHTNNVKNYFSNSETLTTFLCDFQRQDSKVCLKPRIWSFIFDGPHFSKDLKPIATLYKPLQKVERLISSTIQYDVMVDALAKSDLSQTVYLFYGLKGMGKKAVIKTLSEKTKRGIIFVESRGYSHKLDSSNTGVASIFLECILMQSYLCIEVEAQTLEEQSFFEEWVDDLIRLGLGRIPGLFLCFQSDKKPQIQLNAKSMYIHFPKPSLLDSHAYWIEGVKDFPLDPQIGITELGNKFISSPGQIKEIMSEALARASWKGQEIISEETLNQVIFDTVTHRLGDRGTKIDHLYTWDDLILPDYQKNLIKQGCNQITYKYKVFSEWGFDKKMAYGTGLSMLFSGPPGTGKTMAAQVVAHTLGLEIYKVELASVVSKYIGETERHLNEIFEEAKKSQGILFFDEADVLFSKRSEVKDANDKYSNMEAAFMLQKIEAYSGIVLLATNYQQNIDEAFKRRIKFLVDFPFPDKNYRKLLWQRAFPAQLPLSDDIDIDFLADRFELTGSHIKNIALNAAFLSAAKQGKVGMEEIIESVVTEMGKSGKKLSKEELGEYHLFG